MKVDRILEIIIYLLNHDNVPASYLAERFHVSVRTIQRDMVSISSIGIPVYADTGTKGGYSILPNYKKNISFDYRNANGEYSHPTVQPLAIHYKWYAWYLFTYEEEKQDYRTFKVARMDHLAVQKRRYVQAHGNIEERMKESEQAYYKTCIHIEVQFEKDESALMKEYFPDCSIEKVDDRVRRSYIDVPAKERLWKALLLSFGSKVKVIGPDYYREELITIAQNFLSNYDI